MAGLTSILPSLIVVDGELVDTITSSLMNLHFVRWIVTDAELLPESVTTNLEVLAKEYTGLEQGETLTAAVVAADAPRVRDTSVRVRLVPACGACKTR